ncbi:MAG: serine/threonine protein kinase [Planctomycetes bacterium]|nr:serine/threonine protein kinase [Planctomycetota bacterium]
MSWHIGDRVDGYELRAELGRGGMGVVYQGLRIETGSTVAIKTLHIQDPEELLRFEREGVALARLRHPNLIRVHAAGRHEGCPYLVLQHAGGGSLADRLTQGPLPWEAATALVEQLAAGLEVAHAHGILHRDLKPANVLFSRDEIPLLADFGLAKVSDLSRLTETGTVLGSPLFMAPEQARGEDSGPAADVYGLGAILFVCLSGEPPIPFRGTVMAQLISLQEETPRRLGPPTPSWLAELVSRALAGDPKARPSLAELRASLAGTGLPKRPARWGRLIVGALAGSSLLAFGLFGPPLTRQGNPTPSRPSSPHPATSPAPTPARTSVPQFSELEVLIPRWISRPESVKALKAARARLSAAATPKARREVEAKLAEAANAERSHDQEVARVALLELRYLGWLGPICAELVDFDAEERGFLQHAGDFGYGKAHDVLGGRMERRRSRSVGVAHRFLSLAQSFHPRREDLKPHWDEFKTVYADDLPGPQEKPSSGSTRLEGCCRLSVTLADS